MARGASVRLLLRARDPDRREFRRGDRRPDGRHMVLVFDRGRLRRGLGLLRHRARSRTGGRMRVAALALLSCLAPLPAGAEPEFANAGSGKPLTCPLRAIPIAPASSIQDAVNAAGPGASFCLRAGEHRAQAVRPLNGQTFQGEPGAILSGAVNLAGFQKQDGFWMARFDLPPAPLSTYCLKTSPACATPEVVFVDDRPLAPVSGLAELRPGRAFLDARQGRVYLAEEPNGRRVEIAVAPFAFRSSAFDVTIRNLT